MKISRRNFGASMLATGSTAALPQLTNAQTGNESTRVLPDGGSAIQLNRENPLSHPFLLLQVNQQEGSNVSNRASLQEYKNREPVCVKWRNVVDSADTKSISLIVTNLAQFASDAVRIQYQFVYCTSPGHSKDQGFTVDHTLEVKSPADRSFFVEFVPAAKSRPFLIPYPIAPLTFVGLKNLYFRARVSTLWDARVPIDKWAFATDPKVTEATRVFP